MKINEIVQFKDNKGNLVNGKIQNIIKNKIMLLIEDRNIIVGVDSNRIITK